MRACCSKGRDCWYPFVLYVVKIMVTVMGFLSMTVLKQQSGPITHHATTDPPCYQR